MSNSQDRPVEESSPEGCTNPDAGTEAWETGLEWGDVSLIRRQLDLTPTERLRSMQDLVNIALKIRAQNAT